MTNPTPSKVGDYIKVSTVSSTIILTAMSILAAGFIFWCFCGSITDREYIKGVVFPSEVSSGVSVPNDGTVREILVHKGDFVSKGQTLALISVSGSYSVLSAPYEGKVLAFIPKNGTFSAFEDIVYLLPSKYSGTVRSICAFADFKSSRIIKPGQEIQATPMEETRERVGFVRGRILSVSSYPVSYQESVMKLQNKSLADEIFPDEGSVFEVEIELDVEEDNPENLSWSFPLRDSPDMSVGTFCNIEVITKSRSVFNYLLENVQETRNSLSLWKKK